MRWYDNWVQRVARKDFSKTINWIEAGIVCLLAGLLATLIYLDVTYVEISIPIRISGERRFVVASTFLAVIPRSSEVVLISGEKLWRYKIVKKEIRSNGDIVFLSTGKMPSSTSSPRLFVARRSVLNMLLRTRSFSAE